MTTTAPRSPSPEAETYSFRLFASTSTTTSTGPLDPAATHEPGPRVARITLDPAPSTTHDDPKPLKSSRPASHYLATPPTPAQRLALLASAVDGASVRARSAAPCYGWRMPWRVLSASIAPPAPSPAPTPAPTGPPGVSDERPGPRTRRGKKARLRIRVRVRARELERARRAEEERGKEAYLREKKTRTNRAKQIKKREKARREKEGRGEGGPEDAVEEGPPV